MRNGVQLITYVDRLAGGSLSDLEELLRGPLADVFTGVHLLPVFTPFDGADAGFDPIDHTTVDPRLGTWDDIRRLSATHDLTVDLIVNHISDRSPQFLDFLARGDASPYADMFLQYGTVFPEGATQEELLGIYRPRPGLPFTTVLSESGARLLMWTTFTSHQVDLDVTDSEARSYLFGILDQLASAGVKLVRLDAIGYAIKTSGTSSFMTEETYRFIEVINREVRARGMESLLEIHSHHREQLRAAEAADWVYDFALPPLILHALYTGSVMALKDWLRFSPRNAITVLDTHDGIGVIDIGPGRAGPGLLPAAGIDHLVEEIHRATDGESRLATGVAASNLDLYQVNTTYFSALGGDEESYLLARLIQFVCPGIPQVYYAGLLAAPNDLDLLGKTGVGRDINRPYFTREQVLWDLGKSVVSALLALIRFRNTEPAFAGRFTLEDSGPEILAVSWSGSGQTIRARIDVARRSFRVRRTGAGEKRLIRDWDEF